MYFANGSTASHNQNRHWRGFAQGLDIPVIWTTREGTIDHVHSDTSQYNHVTWAPAEDLREKLKARIGVVLGYGPLGAR